MVLALGEMRIFSLFSSQENKQVRLNKRVLAVDIYGACKQIARKRRDQVSMFVSLCSRLIFREIVVVEQMAYAR